MINLNQRHVLTIIDLLRDEENRLEATGMRRISPAGSITVENWEHEEEEVPQMDKKKYLSDLRKLLEGELNKATFSFGLNEKVGSIT